MNTLSKLLKNACINPEDLVKQITQKVDKNDPMYKVHRCKMKRLKMLLRF